MNLQKYEASLNKKALRSKVPEVGKESKLEKICPEFALSPIVTPRDILFHQAFEASETCQVQPKFLPSMYVLFVSLSF